MKMNRTKIAAVLVCTAVALTGPKDARAMGVEDSLSNPATGPAVQIVNDHGHQLRVYLVTADGKAHWLEIVDPGVESVSLPEDLLAEGPVQIKVEPILPLPAVGTSAEGIAVRTGDLNPRADADIIMFIEKKLEGSTVYVGEG